MKRRHLLAQALAGVAAAFPAASALAADEFPSRAMTMVIPSAAGGTLDILGRAMADELGKQLGQPVIVDNKPGAGMVMGTNHIAKAAPDGYTFGLTLTQAVVNNLFLMAKVPYDPRRDLAYISELCTAQVVLVVNASLPVHTAQELLAWAKAHPAKASYGSWGAGSYGHVMGSHLGRTRGVDMTHVPYKGEAPMLQDLVGGQVAWAIGSIGGVRPHLESGRLRALAVTGDQRLEEMPKVPTLAQAGLGDPELKVTGQVLMIAPAATPAPVLARIEKAALASLDTAAVRARLQTLGMVRIGSNSRETRASYDANFPMQEKLIKGLGIKVD
ncbi:Tripartite tricarboxylate transporter family receptor [Variovorax boronicumulans]|uniref:Bug family tripartite tricarboxylate transporter substrate binding protein n=1 Tax=Variovorax boronicumulans TaxID=436515 RepID=UPI000BB2FC98|nr:tripartite tricarboxylate transporter substrate binding protein [Variovorax boronicumulans]PBI95781.1 Tripartite tricarboxylate transporter family receptor [Variovorax boronicumulans]